MNPISLIRLHKPLLPNPRSHWSATGPRSKTQPTSTRNAQWKNNMTQLLADKTGQAGFRSWSDRHSGTLPLNRQGKPVRPVWQTGQTGFVRELPKTPSRPKLPQYSSRTSPPVNKKSHSTTETFLLKNTSGQPTGLNRSDWFGKLVRPVFPGQSGRTQPAGKTQLFKQSISQFVP
jgi:hypothetical protein